MMATSAPAQPRGLRRRDVRLPPVDERVPQQNVPPLPVRAAPSDERDEPALRAPAVGGRSRRSGS